MSGVNCPVCHTAAAGAEQSVSGAALIACYQRQGIDVAPYVPAQGDIGLHRCSACDLGFFAPARAGDGDFYAQLQRHDWYYQDDKPEYPAAAAHVADGSSVLEVGCGKGAFRAWLPASVRYTGLEFNDAAIARARAAGLDVRKEPVEAHAAAGARYDVVCSFQVLEHVEQPGSFFAACADALKPGGTLIVAVPAQDSFLAVAANAPLNMPPHHLTRWSDAALRQLARRAGLTDVALWHEPVAPFHREWQRTVLALHALGGGGRRGGPLLDTSIRYRLLGRVLRWRRLRDALAARAERQQPELGHGHTVMLVAR